MMALLSLQELQDSPLPSQIPRNASTLNSQLLLKLGALSLLSTGCLELTAILQLTNRIMTMLLRINSAIHTRCFALQPLIVNLLDLPLTNSLNALRPLMERPSNTPFVEIVTCAISKTLLFPMLN